MLFRDYRGAQVTQTTVLPDVEEESASGIESPAPSHAASRDDIGAAMFRLQGETPPEVPERQALNEATETPETDSEHAADPALNSDAPADGTTTSRRGPRTQSRIDELEAELQQLKAKVETPQSQPAAEPDADDPVAKAEATIAELRGTDEDWKDLKARVVDGLSFEEAERYRRMQAVRDFEEEWDTLASARATRDFMKYRDGHFQKIAEAFAAINERDGIDPDFVKNHPDLSGVFTHIYDAGRKSVSDENDQLRGEIKNLKAERLTTAPRLPMGGRTSLGTRGQPDRDAEPQEIFTAALRQSDQRRAKR